MNTSADKDESLLKGLVLVATGIVLALIGFVRDETPKKVKTPKKQKVQYVFDPPGPGVTSRVS